MGTKDGVSVSEVGLTRRWLWEQFNVVQARRPPPPPMVQEVWEANSLACARSLRRVLAVLVEERRCEAVDALAWGRAASLEGRKVPRQYIESQLGLSARAVDNRLNRIDALIATFVSKQGFPSALSGSGLGGSIIFGLIESALSRADGLADVGDGFYLAAADLAGLELKNRAKPLGRDRSVRNRTRGRARLAIQLAQPVQRRELLMARGTGARLSITTSQLSDDPDTALDELEKSWSQAEFLVLPLLLSNAIQVVPDAAGAGISRRRRLLELGSNIYRDAESLTALAWTSSWIEETYGEDAESLRAEIQGRKTRAHVLQLHGFSSAAATELDRAMSSFRRLEKNIGDYDLLGADLLVRRAALDVIVQDPRSGRNRLHPLFSSRVSSHMQLSALRYMLHLESVAAARNLRRRSFSGRYATSYETALGRLQAERVRIPVNGQLAVADTIIAAAMRVGDLNTIREIVNPITWAEVRGSPNVVHRLAGRLRSASKLSGLQDLADIDLPNVEHPLRTPGLVPRQLSFLL